MCCRVSQQYDYRKFIFCRNCIIEILFARNLLFMLSQYLHFIIFLKNLKGYKHLGDGWVTIFNGYQYKKTPRAQSWEASRSTCQSWGGDLAVYGVQGLGSRR